MSTHWHFVVRAPNNNLARFMAYVSGNVARAVNRIRQHHGEVWDDRYSAQPILDEEALRERIEYTEMILSAQKRAESALAGDVSS